MRSACTVCGVGAGAGSALRSARGVRVAVGAVVDGVEDVSRACLRVGKVRV